MKILGVLEAERSRDIHIQMVATRASRYRVFGSAERIPTEELFVVDLRDGEQPDDYQIRFKELERHPAYRIVLVRRLAK